MTRFKGVIFDLEGTVLQSNKALLECSYSPLEGFSRIGLNVKEVQLQDKILDFLNKLAVQAYATRFSFRTSELASDLLNKIEEDMIEDAVVVEDIESTLSKLKEAKMALGLVSSLASKHVMNFLSKKKLDSCFDIIVTREDVSKLRPSREPLDKAISGLGKSPNDLAFVGDTVSDLLSVRMADARVKVVMVTWGTQSADILRKASPDSLVDSNRGLLSYLVQ